MKLPILGGWSFVLRRSVLILFLGVGKNNGTYVPKAPF